MWGRNHTHTPHDQVVENGWPECWPSHEVLAAWDRMFVSLLPGRAGFIARIGITNKGGNQISLVPWMDVYHSDMAEIVILG